MADADVTLVVVDLAAPVEPDDLALIERAQQQGRWILVGNKADLPRGGRIGAGFYRLFRRSRATGSRALREAIAPMASREQDSGFITSIRHEQLLRESIEALRQARKAAEFGIPHEMLLLDLYAALRPLDAITGATTADDILNRIFSTFCIGNSDYNGTSLGSPGCTYRPPLRRAAAGAAASQPNAQAQATVRKQGQLDGSETLFTVLAAINAAGYDANLDSNANSPVRKQIREALASKHLDSVDALKKFMADHHQEDPEAELSQYISFALSLEGPPDFQFWLPPQEIPPDVRKLDGLNELIADFYSEAGIEDLWKQAQPELEQVIQAYHGGVMQAVLEANAYLRNPTSGYRGRRFQVYVDLLGAPNQIQTRSYKDNYFVVVTPSPEPQIDQVRHAYLHYLLDPLSLRYFEQWGRLKGVADFAQAAPALDEAYKNDFMLLATECVIKAVESRLAHGAQNRQALVNQASSQGFVLTAALADGLAVYEKQPESLRIYFPDLLGQIDLEREDRRLQKVEFAKDATVHKAKPAPAPPAPV